MPFRSLASSRSMVRISLFRQNLAQAQELLLVPTFRSSVGQSDGLLVRYSVQLSYSIYPFFSTGYIDAPL